MNRRSFITALVGGVVASAAGAVVASESASALSLPAGDAAKLDAVPAEFTQFRRRPRRRRVVCSVRRGRFGRPVRVCRTVYY